MVEPDRTQMTK